MLLTLISCAENDDGRVPWEDRNFITPTSTSLKVTNTTDSLVKFNLFPSNFPDVGATDRPKSLAPGTSYTYTAEIYRPLYIFLEFDEVPTMRALFPGYDRALELDREGVINTGPAAAVYDYFDGHLEALSRPGAAPSITDIDAYGDTLRAKYGKLKERAETIPDWLPGLVETSIATEVLSRQLSLRSYYRFMLKDTMPVSPELRTRVRAQLREEATFHAVEFTPLLELHAVLLGEDQEMRVTGVGPRNQRSITRYLLDSFPLPERRADAIASYLFVQVHDTRVYAGKDENIDLLLQALPADYRNNLEAIMGDIALRLATDDGVAAFLATPMETLDGDQQSPAAARQSTLTLYKFWFEGCYPCLVQQPDEAELLRRHPELELIYVAFSTRKDRWPAYLEKHAPPATAHLYLPKTQTDVVRRATGRAGAPTYLLMRGDEVVCRNCPKPSDGLLEELLL